MRNRLLVITLVALLAAVTVGCGKEASTDLAVATFERLESTEAEEAKKTNVETTEEVAEENVTQQEDAIDEEFSFEDLSKVRFEFCSGAGGWLEEFQIESDGSFTGYFYDSNMGQSGDGYPDGTVYKSDYSGHFTDLIQINEHTYQMKLADISYKEKIGDTEISDDRFWYYTGSYCLGGNDTFTIYLPGTPLSEISEDVYIWLRWVNESDTELTVITIVDESNGYGIYSLPRRDPLEDAEMEYNSCKEAYDNYCGLISEADTTVEMLEYNIAAYECSDDCLNYIWDILRNNVEEDQFAEILEEQRAWIKEKENAAEEARAEFGGSFAEVIYYDTLAEYTINRCAELAEYLK